MYPMRFLANFLLFVDNYVALQDIDYICSI